MACRSMLDAAEMLQDLRVPPGNRPEKEFLQPLGISQYRLAKNIQVHPRLRGSG